MATAKQCLFFLCDEHLPLLASQLYLVDVSPAELRQRIDQLWEHRHTIPMLTAFVADHKEWMYSDFPFC